MFSLKFRFHSHFFTFLFLVLLGSEAQSQGFTSPIQWHNYTYDARVAALGQSTATLMNNSAYHVNPAVPLENGVITASSYLPSTTPFNSNFVEDYPKLYSPAIGYSSGRFSYMAMLDHSSFIIEDGSSVSGRKISNSLLRLQLGYQINENFYTGAGFVYSSYKSPSPQACIGLCPQNRDATAWGLTFGAYFQDQFEAGLYQFRPQIGLSLNDLSTGFEFEGSDFNDPMPGQIRLGFGMDISTKQNRNNVPILGLGIYTGFNKYLSRLDLNEETNTVNSPSGFKALFSTWNSISRFNGIRNENVTVGQQISKSIGVEFNLLETLYVRYGLFGGAEYWLRNQHALGFEVDFYYVALSVTNMSYHSSDEWLPQEDILTVQATLRIPLDGKSRKNLFGN